MNKTTANHIAREAYRLAMTHARFETCTRDYHTNYYPDENVVTVHYLDNKERERMHICNVRKNWIS
jgi:hypothetical protein